MLSEDGQSRIRVEGFPVEVGLVISVNRIWTEDVVVVGGGREDSVVIVVDFAALVVLAPLGRERPAPRPPPRAAAIITIRATATNAQNALLLS